MRKHAHLAHSGAPANTREGGRFAPPPFCDGAIVRARLARPAGACVSLALAPAGYGKTTLLAQWRDHAHARFKPWLTLGPMHRDYERLRDDLGRAFGAAGLPAPAWKGPPEEDGAACAEALSGAGAFLTLDAYEAASSPRGDAFVRALLSAGQAQVALGARTHPRVGVEALMTQAALHLVREELAFNADEAVQFCADWLTVEEARALFEASEGWPGGFRLARQVCAGAGNWRSALDDVATYLLEETFAPLSEPLQAILTACAFATTLEAHTLNVIGARSDGAALMQDLALSGALLFRADQRGWRRHRLLERLLRARFAQLPALERRALCARTGAYLAEIGEIGAAFAMAAHERDPAALAELDASLGGAIWSSAALASSAALRTIEPQLLDAAPRLALLAGLSAPMPRRQSALYVMRQRAEARMQTQERRALDVFLAAYADAGSDAEVAIHLDDARTGFDWASACALSLRAGQIEAARDWARRGVGPDAGGENNRLAALAACLLDLGDARPRQAHDVGRRCARAAAPDPVLEGLSAAVMAECGAFVVLEGDPVEDAAARLSKAGVFAPEVLVETARAQALGLLAGARAPEAMECLAHARALARERGWRRAGAALTGYGLRVALRARDQEGARTLARALKAGPNGAEGELALALYEARQGANDFAQRRLDELLATSSLTRRVALGARVQKLRLAMTRGDQDGQGVAIAAALALCTDAAMAATWFEDGDDVWEALSAFAARHAAQGGASFSVLAALAVARPRFKGSALAPPNAQERALLTALGEAGGRAQAASALGLSENTVKFYLKRLFKKWRLSDWRLAVAVGERLREGRA